MIEIKKKDLQKLRYKAIRLSETYSEFDIICKYLQLDIFKKFNLKPVLYRKTTKGLYDLLIDESIKYEVIVEYLSDKNNYI